MVSRPTANYLLVLVAVVLLLNPLYLYPDGITMTHGYEVDEVTEEDYDRALFHASNVVFCGETSRADRPCPGEQEILEDGPTTVDGPTMEQPKTTYDVVVFAGPTPYRTVTTTENGSVIYDLEPIDFPEAMEVASVSTDDPNAVSARAETAVEDGEITSVGPVPELEDRSIIEHDGDYYQGRTTSFRSSPEPRPVPLFARGGLTLLGLGLLGATYYRFRRGDGPSADAPVE